MIITKANVSEYKITGVFEVAGSFKADGDSDESKSFVLEFDCEDGVNLSEFLGDALANKKITWVNNNRKNWNSISDKARIRVPYRGGRAPRVDPETAMVNKLAAMSPADAKAYLESLMAKIAK